LGYPRDASHVRLKEAVRRHRALSREGLLERLFGKLFHGLVYTQIWEDPDIDLEALALTPDCLVVAIASGGCNVLSYLTGDPARITAVDLGLAHVALNRLKLVAASRLSAVRRDCRAGSAARCVAGWRCSMSGHGTNCGQRSQRGRS
jgi:S-adenosylmethionine-diacylglycerol 3-amino-3-carboxypropyl transferase